MDNDTWPSGNCASAFKTGWWFYDCFWVLFTGTHGERGQRGPLGHRLNIAWKGVADYNTEMSLKFVQMVVY